MKIKVNSRQFFSAIFFTFILCLFLGTNALAAAIWTTSTLCASQDVQDDNEYSPGETIVIRVTGLSPNTLYDWSITGQPASCDPNTEVASGSKTTDSSGDACVEAYTVAGNDCGVYKVNFGGKNDNYHVAGELPPDTGAISITKEVTGECSGVSFEISITGPSPSTDTSSLTIQCNNGGNPVVFDGLAPGTYAIDEDPGTGWHHQTSLPHNVTVVAGQTTEYTITNAPNPSTGIPTLSEWGMIIMSLLLAGSAIWMIRRRQTT
jgi:hypothetical protein